MPRALKVTHLNIRESKIEKDAYENNIKLEMVKL